MLRKKISFVQVHCPVKGKLSNSKIFMFLIEKYYLIYFVVPYTGYQLTNQSGGKEKISI